MTTRKPQIFIAHAANDKGRIKPIAETLLHSGYGLFIDRPEEFDWGVQFCRENEIAFQGGTDIGPERRAAVENADAVLGCLSHNLARDPQL